MILGPGIPVGTGLRADDAGIARARALLEELRETLDVDDPSAFAVERAVAVRNAAGQDLVLINFKQTARGLDVWHEAPGGDREKLALVRLRINATLGVVTMLGSDAVRGLELPADTVLDEGGAAWRALETLGAGSTTSSLKTRSYVSVRPQGAFVAREARLVTVGPPHAWRVVFDAHTGRHV